MTKIKIFMVTVMMVLNLHSEMSFVSSTMELPVTKEIQFKGKMLNLSKDRIVIKRRRYKGRHQSRRYNATKKKRIDSRWKNQSRRFNTAKRKRTDAKRRNY